MTSPHAEALPLARSAGRVAEAYGATGEAISLATGLSSVEAARRLRQHGPNKLEGGEKESFLRVLLRQMVNLIFLLTITSSIICFATGDKVKGTFMVSLVCCVCTLNAIGEYTGQNPSAALLDLMKESATVMRDGTKESIPVENIVPGDIVVLGAGDMIPADMRVLESVDLQTNEATLTGEANEVTKTVEKRESETAFPTNMLYKSTDVVAGSGIGEVVATGMETQVGLIAKRLKAESGRGVAQKLNPLQRSINVLASIIGTVCAIVISLGTALSFVTGYQSIPAKCQVNDRACILYDSIVRGLLMAVAIIPHGLPLVVTVMLQVGSKLMADRHALVTRQSAVDYLGAANVICTDKTGTLTEGKMAARALLGLLRNSNKDAFRSELSFYPLRGLDPQGGVFASADLTDTHRKALDAGAHADGVPGLRCLTSTEACSAEGLLARASTAAAFLSCHGVRIAVDAVSGAWRAEGSMSEAALKVAAHKGGIWEHLSSGKELAAALPRDPALEVAFTSRRKMSATVHQLPADRQLASLRFGQEHTHVALVKGAPDGVLPHLGALLQVSEKELTVASGKLSEEERLAIEGQNQELARQALRSLLLAVRPLTAEEVKALKEADGAEERLRQLLLPGPLAFLGLWGIFDPPRSSVPPSIQLCHQAGIRVVMITGDQRPTAVAIAKLVGIISEKDDDTLLARRCTDLQLPAPDGAPQSGEPSLRPYEEIKEMVAESVVWSRAKPADKVTIVKTLTDHGMVAAMTGDGVNDAPALKRADIGVSMGIAGTAVTKNAAAMVLMDDNFSTIVGAVEEGRKIYGNVQKYVTFNFSVKGGECLCLVTAILLRVPMPIEGLQQLVNLFVTHIIPPMAIAWEDPEEYTMRIPPRKTNGDLVVTRVHMLHRWLPFIVSFCIMVTGMNIFATEMHTGFAKSDSLRGSTVAGAVGRGESACVIGGTLSEEGVFQADTAPFMCRCFPRESIFDKETTTVEQWGRADATSIPFDRWTGSAGAAFDLANTPFAGEGFGDLMRPCTDYKGVPHFCWKDPAGPRPVLSPQTNCAVYGARLGHTIAYVGIHLGEMLALVTYRSDGPFWTARFSWQYAAVLLMNVACLLLIIYVPAFADFLKLAPLSSDRMGLALLVPTLLVLVSEVIKINFRRQLALYHEDLGASPARNKKLDLDP